MKQEKKLSQFEEKSKDLNLRVIIGGGDGGIDKDKIQRPTNGKRG